MSESSLNSPPEITPTQENIQPSSKSRKKLLVVLSLLGVVLLVLVMSLFVLQRGKWTLEACANNNAKMVALLIAAGADVDSPLTVASEKGHIEIVKLLIEKGANVNYEDWSDGDVKTPLTVASEKGHIEIVKLLIEKGADINNKTPLAAASEKGHIEIVKLLIEKGADVNGDKYYGKTPLLCAAYEGHTKIVRLLRAAGANPESLKGQGKRELLEKHGITTSNDVKALKEACLKNDVKIVSLLIAAETDVNVSDMYYITPLHWAAKNGCTEIVKLLIEAGAVVNTSDRLGNTPLREASRNGHKEIVKLLKAAGAKK